MAEFRTGEMANEEINNLMAPENFQKYKDIQKSDIVDYFKTSKVTDEVEGIQVPSLQIDEQLEAVKKKANGEAGGDGNVLRNKIGSTIICRMTLDFLADSADMDDE